MSSIVLRAQFWVSPTRRAWLARLGYGSLGVAYLAATFGVARGSLYLQGLVLVAACFAICALSLDLVAGSTGLYSLGHAGLFAVGAYMTTIIQAQMGWNIFVLLPLSMVAAAVCGLGLGALSLRVSGLYFAILTFVFTLVVGVLLSDLAITGGYAGLPSPSFPNFRGALSGLGSALAWTVMLALLVAIVVTWSIRKSPMHRVLLAIRDAEPFAEAAGVRTRVVKVMIFTLSAALTGMAGWAFAFLGFVSPGQFSWSVSVNMLVMVIVGGMNTFLGPIIGAAFVSMFPASLSIDPLWQEVVFGAIFVVVVVFWPRGFMGVVSSLGRRLAPVQPVQALRSGASGASGEVSSVREESALSLYNGKCVVSRVGSGPHGVAVICRGLTFHYGKGPAVLKGVDLTVRAGTIHGLIGPNGSGKSTLADLISGRLRPDKGTVEVNGVRVEQLPAAERARHGFMRTFQSATLVSELSCKDNVAVGYYGRVGGIGSRSLVWPLWPGAQRDAELLSARARAALASVGAAAWTEVRVADLPHGAAQLTQLAAAQVSEPRTLILDEPLTGLSVREVDHVGNVLRSLRDSGVTIILIEHQVRFVFALCDEVTVLSAGEVVASGEASQVHGDPRVREVYLGV